MAEINPPFALQNAGATHTAAGDRMMVAGLLAGSGSGLLTRGGISPTAGSEFLTTQTGSPSMGVLVGSGVCYVAGTESPTQGVYACVNDTTKTLTVTTAHGTLPRIDRVVARIYDSAYSGALNQWALEVIAGTAASSPVAPTLPANALALYNINVGAAVTSITNANISDARTYVSAVGGIIAVANQAERDALLSTVSNGQAVFRLDIGTLEVKYNNQWNVRSQQQLLVSNMVTAPPFNVNGSYVDFLSGSWAPITFNAPRSGSVRVTVSASIFNNNTSTSTIWAAYRMSGAITTVADESSGLSAAGTRVYASRSRVFTGLTIGASCTVTPQWNISSGTSATCLFSGGQLTVELLP